MSLEDRNMVETLAVKTESLGRVYKIRGGKRAKEAA